MEQNENRPGHGEVDEEGYVWFDDGIDHWSSD